MVEVIVRRCEDFMFCPSCDVRFAHEYVSVDLFENLYWSTSNEPFLIYKLSIHCIVKFVGHLYQVVYTCLQQTLFIYRYFELLEEVLALFFSITFYVSVLSVLHYHRHLGYVIMFNSFHFLSCLGFLPPSFFVSGLHFLISTFVPYFEITSYCF